MLVFAPGFSTAEQVSDVSGRGVGMDVVRNAVEKAGGRIAMTSKKGSGTTVLPGTMFRVELDNKHLVLATICGKMRKRWVRLTIGDRVKMEMSPYDLNKARITWRLR